MLYCRQINAVKWFLNDYLLEMDEKIQQKKL